MKKIILIAAIAMAGQISVAQVGFGIQAGANFGMGKFEYDNAAFSGSASHSQKNKVKVGLLAGFVASVPINSMLAFRPELNFIQEGTKQTISGNYTFYTFEQQHEITLNYIQLPLNVVYKIPAGAGTAFLGLGPVLQFGISGKDKYKFTSATDPADNETKTYDVKFDGKKSDDITDPNDTDGHLKRFDAGINVLAGYKLPMGVFVKLGYSHGFINIDPNKDNADASDRSSYKNSGFNVVVGYMFGGSKKK